MSKKVKFSYSYPNWPVMQQTPGASGVWGGYKFYLNNDSVAEYDYWVVYNSLLEVETAVCPPEHTVFVSAEPYTVHRYSKKFLSQFSLVITCQREIEHSNTVYSLGGHPWLVGKTYDELTTLDRIEKSKLLSVVSSDKAFTEGHRKRLNFVRNLARHFGDKIDVFGRGLREFEDKWDVLAPYKYSIAIENCVYPDWLTEKLYDCYLAHTFPIYCGCPNAEEYFDGKSFLRIDIDDFRGSVRTIETLLQDETFYEDKLDVIKRQKMKYLNRYNIFPFLVEALQSLPDGPRKKKMSMRPDKYPFLRRIARRALDLITPGSHGKGADQTTDTIC